MRFNLYLSKIKELKGLRRIFNILGPTWQSTPGRRCIQALCLILFLVLLFYFCRPDRYDYSRQNNYRVPEVELFLILDPLVSISAALVARTVVWSLVAAAAVLLLGVIIPRWFCGYVCPLGTIIDLFDWGIGRRIKRFRVKKRGWWVNLRFYILTGTIVAAIFGVMLSGFFAAIPLVTRGLVYIFLLLQSGLLKGSLLVPETNVWQYISIIMLLAVLGLGLLRPRFWCAYICPSGAILSLASVFRLTSRKVEATCTECGRCLHVCPFDAIGPDFSTRAINCATCKSCAAVCPTRSIKFAGRWNQANLKPAALQPSFSRRRLMIGFFAAAGSGAAAGLALANERGSYTGTYPVRPPGSLPENRFRRQCVRCGECLKVCPGGVLQPAGLELGIDGIWTPKVVAARSGCIPFCNNCGQVCPTGAIRKIPLDEKRAARIGLAVVNLNKCLPYAQRDDCGLCLNECAAAGYNAIEFIRIGGITNEQSTSNEDSGYLAPVVLENKCIGCGLCQAKCHAVNVRDKKLLSKSAIEVLAGPGKEDRIVSGLYKQLRDERISLKKQQNLKSSENTYLPDFLR